MEGSGGGSCSFVVFMTLYGEEYHRKAKDKCQRDIPRAFQMPNAHLSPISSYLADVPEP